MKDANSVLSDYLYEKYSKYQSHADRKAPSREDCIGAMNKWKEEIETEQDKELVRIIYLLQKQVMRTIDGSLSNKIDYWVEYCHANKIEQ